MGDSDEDEGSSNNYQLTSILFGNIDESGQLEDDILDSVSKRHLASLARLGLSSIINELIDDAELGDKSVNSSENTDVDKNSSDYSASNDQFSQDFDIKSPSAIDYSDINELADDFITNGCALKSVKNEEDNTDYDADDEGPMKDIQLMPPPPMPDPNKDANEDASEDGQKKKLETPLAAMLPSKYANVDVRELFPDFRHDKVLRFSRLFGPGKPSSMPQIWRSVRKRRKKRKHQHNNQQQQSDSGSDQEMSRQKKVGWVLQYGPPPPLFID